MQPVQRLPGPESAARSSEEAERAAPLPLTEVRALLPAHGPQTLGPSYPQAAFLAPSSDEGKREGGARRTRFPGSVSLERRGAHTPLKSAAASLKVPT
ncbi:hypothetical protein H920_02661 [Fukomys damarensis]|uniref:Uncharacterized protein n=1 Tax=Fukomys damarensis TaxID=885580 RepID=A0A091DUZ0_FUKDA|nr:hypothetical protein H920_02661 [Fukomys damarensis]